MTETNESLETSNEDNTIEEDVSESSTENDTAKQPETVNEQEHPKTNWAQKRINELTAEKYALKRAHQEAIQEAQHLREQYQDNSGQDINLSPDTISTYVKQEAERLIQEQQFNDRCNNVYAKGTKEYSDFDAALSNLAYVELTPEFLDIVSTSDNAEKVLYHLAKNLDDTDRILKMSPVKMARELTKLEYELAKPIEKRTLSNAPEPIKSIQSKTRASKSVEDMSNDEYLEWRKKGRI